jgi:hypothetical protein
VNLWDSVQRGLERASQEAGRIARIQRLRITADGLTHQIQVQHNQLIDKVLELFNAGHLTQPELLTICQQLIDLRQQLAQVQQELKQMQSYGAGTGQQGLPGAVVTSSPLSRDNTLFPAPPPSTGEGPALIPPPPPLEPPVTVSAFETAVANAHSPQTSAMHFCSVCQAELLPGHAFCHNCGAPITSTELSQPTVRSNAPDELEAHRMPQSNPVAEEPDRM